MARLPLQAGLFRREAPGTDTNDLLLGSSEATPSRMNPPSEMRDGRSSWTSTSLHSPHGALLNPITSPVVQLTPNPKDSVKYLFAEDAGSYAESKELINVSHGCKQAGCQQSSFSGFDMFGCSTTKLL
ncbi:hypothetical protein NQZ68_017092 [Dissostichus eleginoides]|nr:hypothetical protein NQZ68_017092 [Dissostichus eleginoides]